MSDETNKLTAATTPADAYAAAVATEQDAQRNAEAAAAALAQAIAARQALLDRAGVGDASVTPQTIRRSEDQIADAQAELSLATARAAFARKQLDASEVPALAATAASIREDWNSALRDLHRVAREVDAHVAAAKAAAARLVEAHHAVADAHRATWAHDQNVGARALENAVLASLHTSLHPLAGRGIELSELPDLMPALVTKQSGTLRSYPSTAAATVLNVYARHADVLAAAAARGA